MNEIKVSEERFMDLLMVERSFKELLEYLYSTRETIKAYADDKVIEEASQYKIDNKLMDEILEHNIKGFKK